MFLRMFRSFSYGNPVDARSKYDGRDKRKAVTTCLSGVEHTKKASLSARFLIVYFQHQC